MESTSGGLSKNIFSKGNFCIAMGYGGPDIITGGHSFDVKISNEDVDLSETSSKNGVF